MKDQKPQKNQIPLDASAYAVHPIMQKHKKGDVNELHASFTGVKAIVVVQTAFLGDLLLSIPLLKTLKSNFPEHKLILVCRKEFQSLFLNLLLVDYAFGIKKNLSKTYNDIVDQLKRFDIDYLYCPHSSFRSFLFCSKVSAKQKISFHRWWKVASQHRLVKRNLQYPDALRQLQLLENNTDLLGASFFRDFISFENSKQLDIIDFSNKNIAKHLQSTDAKLIQKQMQIPKHLSMFVEIPEDMLSNLWQAIYAKYNLSKSSILIAPASVWPTKMWTSESFVTLAKNLQNLYPSKKIYWIGAPNEFDLCESLRQVSAVGENLAGKLSLFELFVLMKESHLFFGNDSGAMHLASAANLQSFVFFGPTTLSLGYRPWNNNAVVLQKNLSCRPCGLHGHKTCPIGTHDCMKMIEAKDVMQVLETGAY